MNKNDKLLLEYFCKFYLLEIIKQTKYKNNKNLKRYIVYEMPYHQALLYTFDKKYILTEQDDEGDAYAQSEKRADSLQQQITPFIRFPLSLLVGGKAMNTAAGLGAKVGGAIGGTGIAGKLLSGTAGVVGFVGGAAAFGIALDLFFKVIKYHVQRFLSPCYKKCKVKFGNESEFKYDRKVCESQCRINAYNGILRRLREQRGKCDLTGNKNRCTMGINKQIVKYQEMLSKEEPILKKFKEKLENKRTRVG